MISTIATAQSMYRVKLVLMLNYISPWRRRAPLVSVVFYSCLGGKTGLYRSYHSNKHSWAIQAFFSSDFFFAYPFICCRFHTRDILPPLWENRRTYSGIYKRCKRRNPVFEFRRLLLLAARGFPLVERLQCLSQTKFTSWKPHSQVRAHDLTCLHERQSK